MSTFIKKQEKTGSKWHHLWQPFSADFWGISLLVLLVLIFLLSLCWKINYHLMVNQINDNFSMYNSVIYVFGSVCQQGHDITPSLWSCRFVFLTAYLTYLILFTAYSAVFISLLTVRHFRMPFFDFPGLLQNGRYFLGVILDSVYYKMFEQATDPTLHQIYRTLLLPNVPKLPKDTMEGLHRICTDKNYAFNVDIFDVRLLSNELSCEIIEVPHAFFWNPASFVLNKKLPYTRLLSYYIDSLRRSGVLKRLEEISLPMKIEDEELPDTYSTLKETMPIFTIYFAGIGLSMTFLLIEIILNQFMKCIKHQNEYDYQQTKLNHLH